MLEIIVKYIKIAAAVIGTLYISKYVAQSVLSNQHVAVAVLIVGVIIVIRLSDNFKFALFSICVFIPFLFPIRLARNLLCIELIAPIFFIYILFELLINKRQLFFRKAGIFFLAILVLSLWALFNYTKNPVTGLLMGAKNVTEGGIRAYYTILVGIMIFFTSYWFFIHKKLDVVKWMTSLAVVSFVIGYLRLAGYFLEFRLKFIGGTFSFAPAEGLFSRIGGLTEISNLGISVLLALGYEMKWNKMFSIGLTGFFILLIMSGGRAQFFGIIAMLIAYNTVINRKKLLPMIAGLLIVGSLYAMVYSYVTLPDQAQRLIDIQGKVTTDDSGRYTTYQQFIEIFEDNPVFGKGLGFSEAQKAEGKITFMTKQAVLGGHGAYMSILATFGIGGFFYLLVSLLGGIYYAFRIVKYRAANDTESMSALFAFLYLIGLSVVLVSGYAGYDILELYFMTGMVAGILSKDEVSRIA